MVLSGLGGARRRAGRGHRRAALVDAVLVRRVRRGKARTARAAGVLAPACGCGEGAAVEDDDLGAAEV